jgi:adenylate kinase family enzyme
MLLFLCGTPAAGKSCFSKYLHKKHNFYHIDMENSPWSDETLHDVWNSIFQFPNDDTKVKDFVDAVKNRNDNTVLDLGFPVNDDYFRIIKLLEKYGCNVVWFECDVSVARKRYQKRDLQAHISVFETQMQNISKDWMRIKVELKPLIINVLKDKESNKDYNLIYQEILKYFNS